MESIKDRLSLLRKSLGLTQKDFGSRLNLSDAMISHLELGLKNIHPRTVKLLTHIFGVSPEWLLNGTGSMFIPNSIPEVQKRLIEVFDQLTPAAQKLAVEYVKKLLDDEKRLKEAFAQNNETKFEESR
jgi:transcriptional regulator with XRE-family HTH domain